MACYNNTLVIFNVLRTYFNSDRYPFHFILCKFPARWIIAVVKLCTYTASFKTFQKLISLVKYSFFVLSYRNNNCLYRSYGRRKYKSAVVAVSHYYCAYKTCSNAPACLVRKYFFIFFISVFNIKSFCKTISKIMRRTCLKSFTVMHKSFNCISWNSTCKFVAFSFLTFNYRHCKTFFTEVCIHIKHSFCFFNSFFCRSMNGVSFLP